MTRKPKDDSRDAQEGQHSRRRFIRDVAATTAGIAVLGPGCSGAVRGVGDLDAADSDGSTAADGAPADGAPRDGAPADGAPADGAPTDAAPADASPDASLADLDRHVFVARNDTPVANVQNVLALAGGIARFIDEDDVVVLNPNGQWRRQGYTHTESMKALIDAILARPGGFTGEVIITEHVHRTPAETMSGDYCWNMSAGSNRLNNWPDMSYLELVAHYQGSGYPNVTAAPLYDSSTSPDWEVVAGPEAVASGKNGWVAHSYTNAANSRNCRLPHPIIRSSYSDKLIDLSGGVWEGTAYGSQRVRLIFLPTLNNHGSFDVEDYAGPTSAVKCHLGIAAFDVGPGYDLHSIGYSAGDVRAVGQSIGHLITEILTPTFYLTCAEYTGHRGRTDGEAAHTRTVGLCTDPVTLDYWMCKYVMYPIATSQTFMNPDNDSQLRQQLLGCHDLGVGTLDEAEMTVTQVG